MPSLSVIIPCYNEEANLKRGVLDQVYRYLKQQSYQWELIIVNDGSTDNSLTLIKKLTKPYSKYRIVNLSHRGKPWAVYRGIRAAKYEYVLFIDMDQSTPIDQLDRICPYIKQHYYLIIGSRGLQRRGQTLFRKLGSGIFLFLRRLVLLPNIIDTQCGFKAMKTAVALNLFPRLQFFRQKSQTRGWNVSAYDVELLFLAKKLAYQIKEVAVTWQNQDISTTKGELNRRYLRESLQMLWEIIRVKTNEFKGLYR